MTPDEARLALERHATSKLARPRDLARHRQLRLPRRGAAGDRLGLAAPPAYARARREARAPSCGSRPGGCSRRAPRRGARRARASRSPSSSPPCPARRKFLKAAATEWGHVADWLGARGAGAARASTSTCSATTARRCSWPATRPARAHRRGARRARGRARWCASSTRRGRPRACGLRRRGPTRTARPRAGLHLFVNARPVRDRLLRHALLEVYRDLLPRGRFPTAVLFLELPAGARRRERAPGEVGGALRGPARRSTGWCARGRRARSGGAAGSRAAAPALPAPLPRRSSASRERRRPRPGDWLFASAAPPAGPAGDWRASAPRSARARRSASGSCACSGQLLGDLPAARGEGGPRCSSTSTRPTSACSTSACARRGSARASRARRCSSRRTSSSSAASQARRSRSGRRWPGRSASRSSRSAPSAVVVRAVPGAARRPRSRSALVRGLAEQLREGRRRARPRAPRSRWLEAADRALRDARLPRRAPRGRRASQPREQRALLDALDAIPWAPTCPHGRPVAVPFALAEIERRFGRALAAASG